MKGLQIPKNKSRGTSSDEHEDIINRNPLTGILLPILTFTTKRNAIRAKN